MLKILVHLKEDLPSTRDRALRMRAALSRSGKSLVWRLREPGVESAGWLPSARSHIHALLEQIGNQSVSGGAGTFVVNPHFIHTAIGQEKTLRVQMWPLTKQQPHDSSLEN